jgi:hypothetical protein
VKKGLLLFSPAVYSVAGSLLIQFAYYAAGIACQRPLLLSFQIHVFVSFLANI